MTGVETTATTAAARDAVTAGLNVQALDLARSALNAVDAGDASNASNATGLAEIYYLAALASARMGAIDEAEKWLAKIERSPLGGLPVALAVEIWSLDGRIAKERFAAVRDRASAPAQGFARKAIDSYQRAFELGGAAYSAANAATLANMIGDAPLAASLAQQALTASPTPVDHWQHASIAEALLTLDRIDEARQHYREAYRLAGNRFGDISTMRHQLALIGSPAAKEMLSVLPAPRIVAFSGHMIDHPEREVWRFPSAIESAVAAALREKIATLGPTIGYAQAACGADILFLEAMQAAGMQTQIVLPFRARDFVESSVRFAGEHWVQRFERVIAGATRVVIATEETFQGDDILFEHAANLIQGMAFLHARQLATKPLLLTVRDDEAAGYVGGTAATASYWTRKGGTVDNIDLRAFRGTSAKLQAGPVEREAGGIKARPHPSAHQRELHSLLFADVSGFSKMPEQYAPAFASIFLGNCRKILDSIPNPPLHANTHGDGLFLVFALPSHAAEFSVYLQRSLAEVDWPALGLSPETGVRIALHTGPLFRIFDPVTNRHTFYGTHVTRTARLEPVVQPRHIFVTEEFAASLIAEKQDRFHCDYIGTMKLAKQFGEARLYRLHWVDSG